MSTANTSTRPPKLKPLSRATTPGGTTGSSKSFDGGRSTPSSGGGLTMAEKRAASAMAGKMTKYSSKSTEFSPSHVPIDKSQMKTMANRLYTPQSLQRRTLLDQQQRAERSQRTTYDASQDVHLSAFWHRQQQLKELRKIERQEQIERINMLSQGKHPHSRGTSREHTPQRERILTPLRGHRRPPRSGQLADREFGRDDDCSSNSSVMSSPTWTVQKDPSAGCIDDPDDDDHGRGYRSHSSCSSRGRSSRSHSMTSRSRSSGSISTSRSRSRSSASRTPSPTPSNSSTDDQQSSPTTKEKPPPHQSIANDTPDTNGSLYRPGSRGGGKGKNVSFSSHDFEKPPRAAVVCSSTNSTREDEDITSNSSAPFHQDDDEKQASESGQLVVVEDDDDVAILDDDEKDQTLNQIAEKITAIHRRDLTSLWLIARPPPTYQAGVRRLGIQHANFDLSWLFDEDGEPPVGGSILSIPITADEAVARSDSHNKRTRTKKEPEKEKEEEEGTSVNDRSPEDDDGSTPGTTAIEEEQSSTEEKAVRKDTAESDGNVPKNDTTKGDDEKPPAEPTSNHDAAEAEKKNDGNATAPVDGNEGDSNGKDKDGESTDHPEDPPANGDASAPSTNQQEEEEQPRKAANVDASSDEGDDLEEEDDADAPEEFKLSSPRSMIAILRNGVTLEELLPRPLHQFLKEGGLEGKPAYLCEKRFTAFDKRRRATLAKVRADYRTICADVSQPHLINTMRSIDPSANPDFPIRHDAMAISETRKGSTSLTRKLSIIGSSASKRTMTAQELQYKRQAKFEQHLQRNMELTMARVKMGKERERREKQKLEQITQRRLEEMKERQQRQQEKSERLKQVIAEGKARQEYKRQHILDKVAEHEYKWEKKQQERRFEAMVVNEENLIHKEQKRDNMLRRERLSEYKKLCTLDRIRRKMDKSNAAAASEHQTTLRLRQEREKAAVDMRKMAHRHQEEIIAAQQRESAM